jgi:hypothetical protein
MNYKITFQASSGLGEKVVNNVAKFSWSGGYAWFENTNKDIILMVLSGYVVMVEEV